MEANLRPPGLSGRLPNRGSGLESTDLIDYKELKSPTLQADVGSFALF